METIISAFRPYLDHVPHIDIIHSPKLGWVKVTNIERGEVPVFLVDKHHLLQEIAGIFFDQAEGKTTREAIDKALWDMQPYLEHLPMGQREYLRLTLEMYAKLEEIY